MIYNIIRKKLNHYAVHLKLIQYCKSTMLQQQKSYLKSKLVIKPATYVGKVKLLNQHLIKQCYSVQLPRWC